MLLQSRFCPTKVKTAWEVGHKSNAGGPPPGWWSRTPTCPRGFQICKGLQGVVKPEYIIRQRSMMLIMREKKTVPPPPQWVSVPWHQPSNACNTAMNVAIFIVILTVEVWVVSRSSSNSTNVVAVHFLTEAFPHYFSNEAPCGEPVELWILVVDIGGERWQRLSNKRFDKSDCLELCKIHTSIWEIEGT